MAANQLTQPAWFVTEWPHNYRFRVRWYHCYYFYPCLQITLSIVLVPHFLSAMNVPSGGCRVLLLTSMTYRRLRVSPAQRQASA